MTDAHGIGGVEADFEGQGDKGTQADVLGLYEGVVTAAEAVD